MSRAELVMGIYLAVVALQWPALVRNYDRLRGRRDDPDVGARYLTWSAALLALRHPALTWRQAKALDQAAARRRLARGTPRWTAGITRS
jgi:hypothetical protein